MPPGISLIPIDRRTGLRAQAGDPDVILEAFKPGTEPPTTNAIVSQWNSQVDQQPADFEASKSFSYAEPTGSGFFAEQYRELPNGVIIKVRWRIMR